MKIYPDYEKEIETSPFGKLRCFSDKLKLLNLVC